MLAGGERHSALHRAGDGRADERGGVSRKDHKEEAPGARAALLGCSFVTGVWSGDASVTAVGVLFGLGAGFLYALYSIFAPFGLRHYTPFTVVYWTFVFGGLGSLFLLDAGEMRTVFADGRMVLVALGLIVISTVLPYLLYTNGLARVESGKASILASLEPVVASFVGILAFGEPVSLMVFLGLGCILACVYVLR